MKFMERKVCVEFLSKDRIRLTTPYKQKEFEFKKNFWIDCIELKEYKSSKDLKFYALMFLDDQNEPILTFQIPEKEIGNHSFYDDRTMKIFNIYPKTIKTKIPIDD